MLQFLQNKLSQLREEITSQAKTTAQQKIAGKEKVFLQYEGKEVVVDDILEKVKQEFILEGNNAAAIKSIRLYVKPEENAAYYIINEINDDKKVSLT